MILPPALPPAVAVVGRLLRRPLAGGLVVLLLAATATSAVAQTAPAAGAAPGPDDPLGRVHELRRDAALLEADALAADAIATARHQDDAPRAWALMLERALVLADLGRLSEGFSLAAVVAREAGLSPEVRLTLADLHVRRGAGEAALTALGAVDATAGAAADRVAVVRGRALLATGDAAAGERELRRWLDETPADDARAAEAIIDAQFALARAGLDRGAVDDAQPHLLAAVPMTLRRGDRLRLAEALLLDGRRLRLSGDTTGAEEALRGALQLATQAPLPRVAAPAAHALYEMTAARGATGEALEFLRLHTDARLAMNSDGETQRLINVLATLPVPATSTAGPAVATTGLAVTPTSAAAAAAQGFWNGDGARLALLGLSLASLLLAAVLWRVGYTRGRRALHYRQELEALRGTVTRVSALDGLITICASCKDICGDDDTWTKVEAYLAARTDASFTHSVCPTCEQRVLGPDAADANAPSPGNPKRDLKGGFDWPPSDEELARVLRSAQSPQEAATTKGGRWG